jgi:hypothetical protein
MLLNAHRRASVRTSLGNTLIRSIPSTSTTTMSTSGSSTSLYEKYVKLKQVLEPLNIDDTELDLLYYKVANKDKSTVLHNSTRKNKINVRNDSTVGTEPMLTRTDKSHKLQTTLDHEFTSDRYETSTTLSTSIIDKTDKLNDSITEGSQVAPVKLTLKICKKTQLDQTKDNELAQLSNKHRSFLDRICTNSTNVVDRSTDKNSSLQRLNCLEKQRHNPHLLPAPVMKFRSRANKQALFSQIDKVLLNTTNNDNNNAP